MTCNLATMGVDIHLLKLSILVFLAMPTALTGADWQVVGGQMLTRWADEVSPERARPEYPRPQMVRQDWQNLNGLWDYAIVERNSIRPGSWEGKILVPFCVESALSGVKKSVTPDQSLWYRRTFSIPRGWRSKRLQLNFGAVDWEAEVFVNGLSAGSHRGGYTPFFTRLSE